MTGVMTIAKDDLGLREVPPGSNTGPRIREMQRNTWLAGTNWPWCSAAVVTWYKEAGHPLPDPSAGAWDLTERMKRRGWQIPLAQAKPGDIVSFNVGSGHVALFVSVKLGQVRTLDGNSLDMVRYATRPAGLVRDVIRVPGVHTAKPAKKPLWQVVTSESGTRKVVASAKTLNGIITQLRRLRRGKRG